MKIVVALRLSLIHIYVIFAGTENRKPLGYAYVAITLDNSDHSLAIDFNEMCIRDSIL